jgi:hypothetical protein
MSERTDLLKSIADTIYDYRAGDFPQPTSNHVARWIAQFDEEVQIPLLQEVDHVLKLTYFDKDLVSDIFDDRVKSENIAGEKPRLFWRSANFLRIQQNGHSQEELLVPFGESLKSQLAVDIDDCGKEGGPFIYLDDAVFSGSRVGNDISAWIKADAPTEAIVHIIVFVVHSLGEYQMLKRLRKEALEAGKKIDFKLWRRLTLENKKYERDTSEVLWPAILPDDEAVKAYIDTEEKFPFEARKPGGKLKHEIFSSEEGRQLLEREFLLAGIKILGGCKEHKKVMRPLGFSYFGLGFGSMFVTYRNCPNNCPLALWWGDPEAPPSSPLGQWYPLLPRKTYSQGIVFDEAVF